MLSIHEAARLLGGDVTRNNSILCPGKGHSANDRSLSVTFMGNQNKPIIVHSFAGDDDIEQLRYVESVIGARQQVQFEHKPVKHHADDIAKAHNQWKQSVPIAGTLAEIYLSSRCRYIPRNLYSGDVLRYDANGCFRVENGYKRFPMLIAKITDIHSNQFIGIHRTALAKDGTGKAIIENGDVKRVRGRQENGAIRLNGDDEVTQGLHLAEGIETGLSVLNMGYSPLWVTINCSNLTAFPVLNGIESLTIWSDNDTNQAGQKAAKAAAQRWANAGREAWIETPIFQKTDFNDIYRGL